MPREAAIRRADAPITAIGSTTCPHCDARTAGRGRTACSSCGRALTISGQFRLGGELDRGGVARVHEAQGPEGVEVVVKVMERTPLNPWQVHELFARSARLLSTLSHHGVPRVFGFDRSDARSFLVMERLHGSTLWDRVKRGGPLRSAEIDRLLRGLLETVAYLHANALIHGDVTPRNVMFRSAIDDRPVLVDFDGLCRADEQALASLVMTPGYTAPEQRAGEMTIAADLFGVGATVVYAATGQSPEKLGRIGEGLEIDLGGADLSPTTRALLQQLVALTPARRPKTARQALGLLDVAALRVARAPRDARRSSMRRVMAVVMLMLACVLVVSAFALANSTSRTATRTSSTY